MRTKIKNANVRLGQSRALPTALILEAWFAANGEHQSLVIGDDLIRLVKFSSFFRQLKKFEASQRLESCRSKNRLLPLSPSG